MESHVGSTLLPVIKIINNTSEELTNIVLFYEGIDSSSIKISSLNKNSEVITTINSSLVNDTVNLMLSYDHSNIHEDRIVYSNLASNSLVKLTLEISDLNDEHNIVSIIERDPIDNPIELLPSNNSKYKKTIALAGAATLGAFLFYIAKKIKH